MSGALGKKSSTIRNSNKSKDKFIKGDIVQYNPSTRELHYVSEGKHKTVKLEKDEAMRYLKYFRRCTKGLALDYLVQHHFRTNEGTYQVLQLSTRMSSPEETQKIVRDCETKFKKLIELADSKVKSKIVAVHNVVKKMLDAKNRVSIVRDIFFPELVDQHGLKTILDNKDITEFKDRNVDHDKYITYIDSDYEKNGLIKVMKREGAEKTYTYFAAKVCDSIYDNAKLMVDVKKQSERIRNAILVIYMALNSTITQKSICGSLYFPIKENDYFLVNIAKAYGLNQNTVRIFVEDNVLSDTISLGFFTESHEAPFDFDWYIPWKEGYLDKQATRKYDFGNNILDCRKAWFYVYGLQNRGSIATCNRLAAFKALIQWRAHHQSAPDEDIINSMLEVFKGTTDENNISKVSLQFLLLLAIKYFYTFNMDSLPIRPTEIFEYEKDNLTHPGILYELYKEKMEKGANNSNTEFDRMINMLTGKESTDGFLVRTEFVNHKDIYDGKTFNVDNFKKWVEDTNIKNNNEIKKRVDADQTEYEVPQEIMDAFGKAIEILDSKMQDEDKKAEINKIFKPLKDKIPLLTKYYNEMKDDLKKKFQDVYDSVAPMEIIQDILDLEKEEQEKAAKEKEEQASKAAQKIKDQRQPIFSAEQQVIPTEQQPTEQQPTEQTNVGDTPTNQNQPPPEKPVSEGLSLRKLKKMGLKPWQIKQIRKEVKKIPKIPKAGISELETLNEIKDMIETLLKKDKVEPPVDKAKLPIQPPEQTAQLQAQTSKAENIASVPMLLGDDLNARRRALRHVEQTHYVPEVDKNTVKYDIENRNYTLKHVDPVKVAKTLQGLDKMLKKGTLAKNSPYVRLHPGTAAVIKMLATRANPNTYKGGVFRTIASLIPGGSAVYEVASRVYNAARPLIDKAVQKYDEAYNKHMNVKPKGNSPHKFGYMNAKQLKQYLIHNQKPKLSQLSQLLK